MGERPAESAEPVLLRPTMLSRRPHQHCVIHCLRTDSALCHQGRHIKGNWDTRTTRRMTIWLAARPEAGLINQRTWRVLGIRQDTLGLAPALRSREDYAARA